MGEVIRASGHDQGREPSHPGLASVKTKGGRGCALWLPVSEGVRGRCG